MLEDLKDINSRIKISVAENLQNDIHALLKEQAMFIPLLLFKYNIINRNMYTSFETKV